MSTRDRSGAVERTFACHKWAHAAAIHARLERLYGDSIPAWSGWYSTSNRCRVCGASKQEKRAA